MTSNEERFEEWWLENSDEEVKIEYHRCKAAFLAACPQWRQIAEAPKDGTWILAMVKWDDSSAIHEIIHWDSNGYWKGYGCVLDENAATHWMPLPLPPA